MSNSAYSTNITAELVKFANLSQTNRPGNDIPVSTVSGLDFFSSADPDDDIDPSIIGGDELEDEIIQDQQVGVKRKRSTGRQTNSQRTANSLKDDGDNSRRVKGTRKIAPMIEYDAPTQTRNYITPSVTSRKPDSQMGNPPKKRRTTEPLETTIDQSLDGGSNQGDGESELPQSLLSSIEIKRRQNTLAARRSRARKAEHVAELECEVSRLTRERDIWKEKAEKFEEELKKRLGGGGPGGGGIESLNEPSQLEQVLSGTLR